MNGFIVYYYYHKFCCFCLFVCWNNCSKCLAQWNSWSENLFWFKKWPQNQLELAIRCFNQVELQQKKMHFQIKPDYFPQVFNRGDTQNNCEKCSKSSEFFFKSFVFQITLIFFSGLLDVVIKLKTSVIETLRLRKSTVPNSWKTMIFFSGHSKLNCVKSRDGYGKNVHFKHCESPWKKNWQYIDRVLTYTIFSHLFR